jgi:hypothetical protein
VALSNAAGHAQHVQDFTPKTLTRGIPARVAREPRRPAEFCALAGAPLVDFMLKVRRCAAIGGQGYNVAKCPEIQH